MLTLGKGCFWELFSPEWTRFMKDGDKAPTRPSYCHPWSDGTEADCFLLLLLLHFDNTKMD